MKKIKLLMLIDKMYEDLEAWYPIIRLEESGIKVVVCAPEKKTYHGKNGLPIEPEMIVNAVDSKKFDGVVIPGGFAPDFLRRIPKVLEIVRILNKQNKLVAFICHAGWVPISAKILKGRKCTSLPAIKDDMINAGAIWQDSAVVIDGNLVSSRRPPDLEKFCKAILKIVQD